MNIVKLLRRRFSTFICSVALAGAHAACLPACVREIEARDDFLSFACISCKAKREDLLVDRWSEINIQKKENQSRNRARECSLGRDSRMY